MRMLAFLAAGLTTFVLCVSGLPAQEGCPGDCDGDGAVRESDLRGVTAALFDPQVAVTCPAADANEDGALTIADVTVVVGSLLDPACTAPPVSVWVPLTPLGLGPRQEVGVAGLENEIYVIGGFDGEGRVEVYDVFTNDWRAAASLPSPANHVGAAVSGGRVYAIGGFAGTSFTPVSDVFRYDPGMNRWTAVAPLPAARGAMGAATLNGLIHVVGGTGSDGRSMARHEVYDPGMDTWTEVAPLPSARNHLAAVSIGGFLYAVGGRDGSNTAELDRYDPETDRWEVLTPMPTARSGFAAAVLDDRLIVLGGEVNPADPLGVFAEVEAYNPATDSWVSLDPMPVPRHGMGAVEASSLIYVPGGATRAGFGATDHVDAVQIAF